MNRKYIRKLTFCALFLALGLVLPFFTGQIKEIGNMLLPMHIPVMLCGFVCGWQHGAVVGFITPVFRSVLFGMPIMYPNAVAMAFELAAYGLICGMIYNLLKRQNLLTAYISLISAMLGGRVVWGIAQIVILGLGGNSFTFTAFFASAVTNAIPGIILQLILIPPVVVVMKKLKVTVSK